MAEITQILQRMTAGDEGAKDELVPLVYQQLRKIAQNQLAGEACPQVDATELVHEAYVRLIGPAQIEWQDKSHFFATAATAIRRVLVDGARKANTLKRGGGASRAELTLSSLGREDLGSGLIELDEALERLKQLSERQAKLVELRVFGGMTQNESAELLGVSRRTVAGDWAMAKAWLYRELSDD